MVLPETMMMYATPTYMHLALGTPYWHPEMPLIHHEDRFTRDRVESDDATPLPKLSLMTRAKNAFDSLLIRLHLKKAPEDNVPPPGNIQVGDSLSSVFSVNLSDPCN